MGNFFIGFISIILISVILMYVLKPTNKATKSKKETPEKESALKEEKDHHHDHEHGHDVDGENNWLLWLLGVVVTIFIVHYVWSAVFSKTVMPENRYESSMPKDSSWMVTLKKGEDPITIFINSNEKLDLYSGGTLEHTHKYFHRNQNGPWEIWGDGRKKDIATASFVQIKADKKTIEILCKKSVK